MPTALICSEGQGRTEELLSKLSNLKDWDNYGLSHPELPVQFTDNLPKRIDLHFLIYYKQLTKYSIQELSDIRKVMPFITIVYYYTTLLNQQYLILSQHKVNACVVGKQRQKYLAELLPDLWAQHWKKIPPWIGNRKSHIPDQWSKKVILYIENHTLDLCNIIDLAEYFHLSKSHFRSNFRKHFGINFREFKHKLFIHYENKLLLEKNFKPIEVYKLLNYSNLANFSRSFRSRHGESWRNYNDNNREIRH